MGTAKKKVKLIRPLPPFSKQRTRVKMKNHKRTMMGLKQR